MNMNREFFNWIATNSHPLHVGFLPKLLSPCSDNLFNSLTKKEIINLIRSGNFYLPNGLYLHYKEYYIPVKSGHIDN